MNSAKSTLFSQAIIVTDGKSEVGDVLIGSNGTIVAVGGNLSEHPGADQAFVIDAKDHWLMPGCIDDQVHFREPGLTHKAEIATESAAAAAGGASAAGQAAASLTASTAVNTAASGLAGATGSGALSVASRAVGSLMRGAGNFVSKGINVFRNVTEGATNFIKEFSQTAANKLSSTMGFENLPFENAAENFFGAGDSAWKATTDEAGFRMKNLLADKSTTSAFDAAARESRIAISTPTAAITPTKIKGTQVETVKTEVDPNAAIAETETIDLTSNTGGEIDRAGEVQGDVNASFKPTTDSRSVVDKTRDYLQDSLLSAREKVSSEFTNLVPNTIERTAEGITGIPNQLVNTKIQNLMAPDAPQQFVAMGPAQYMAPEIGGGQDVTGMMPLADYGVRMGTMPYGNNAVIAAHQRFMQSSIG